MVVLVGGEKVGVTDATEDVGVRLLEVGGDDEGGEEEGGGDVGGEDVDGACVDNGRVDDEGEGVSVDGFTTGFEILVVALVMDDIVVGIPAPGACRFL